MRNVKVGDRFYSYYFKKECIVTEYMDEDNWWFKVYLGWITDLTGFPPFNYKARCNPNEVMWL